jgi:hypothetical protein
MIVVVLMQPFAKWFKDNRQWGLWIRMMGKSLTASNTISMLQLLFWCPIFIIAIFDFVSGCVGPCFDEGLSK